MIEIEEFEKMLDEIADELPQEFYKELNGGILLLPRAKTNPVGGAKDLYTLGEYHRSTSMGRYIVIYYGSFEQLYGNCSRSVLKKKLAHTLKHEFTHHLESLSGLRDLEKEDEKFLEEYLRFKRPK